MMKEASIVGSFCYGSGDREPEFATAARLTGRWRTSSPRSPRTSSRSTMSPTPSPSPTTRRSGAIKVTLTP